MVKSFNRMILPLAFMASFSLAQGVNQAASPAQPSPSLKQDLAPSLKSIDHPESVVGSGWKEGAAAAAAKFDPKDLKAIQDQTSTAIQKALNDASQTLGLPSPAPAPPAKPTAEDEPVYRLYVSQAMGDAALKDAVAMGQAHRNLHIILRGVLPGQTVMSLYSVLKRVHGDFSEQDLPPTIQIDPTVFSAAGVTTVPALEKIDKQGRSIAIVRGVMDPDWLDRAIADNRHGDLGSFGQTVAVTEIDMLEQMKSEASKLDYEDLAEKAKSRFWSDYKFNELPPATVKRVRHIDPTVQVKDDILTSDGKVVARKGDRFNPLESVPFTQTLVVFDATSPAQLAFAKLYLHDHANERVTLIASKIDADGGWNGYSELERNLDHALFILQEDVRSTFQIEKLPTTVAQSKLTFEVTEIPANEVQAHAAAQP